MAPTKPRSSSGKGEKKRGSKPSSNGSISKATSKPKKPTKQSTTSAPKSKPVTAKEKWMKKKASYSEKELGIQKLNMITPAGVQKVKGKKKGKVFVDDQASMMTLLAMVNAEKEGQIESKMIKARQMEEIRQARQEEMDKRKDERKSKLEDTKDSLRRPKIKKPATTQEPRSLGSGTPNIPKKRVSFG